jgi:hypothetical protein
MESEGKEIMWVFCGGMPRAGSTLQFQLAASIVEAMGKGQRVTWIAPGELDSVLDRENLIGIDVIKSHVATQGIIDYSYSGFGKALYIHRDLRDVVVSFMQHHNSDFNQVWNSGMVDDAVKWGKVWEGLPGVLVQRYDKLTQDIHQGIDEICDYLKLSLPLLDRMKIANSHAIDQQHKRIANIPQGLGWDADELLHRKHIGKANGASQWRKILSKGQVDKIEKRYNAWMIEHKYTFMVDTW